ncbi:peptide/nickel transport system permease protein [Deinococcus metalli]|uniref:Dipeptide/oligopeptide/nickel ABC transporter ATP-binding protein n=1 Tax=Deinococcus metalli TaxID=1141878 RepID=A0A7W8KEX4_9DEIO|nr:dipeptide/oligopeptide/nickel ABC transporter permease/ATP-binding protein [Deinococcus metalli]MBB5376513.1 peptide/nickel transport system permease protein [Deinococcus metalli]GHF43468.1 dipeptide/oligopeptide/nickel ABC transporter ATP-binding protein [Deinococcus metalli]
MTHIAASSPHTRRFPLLRALFRQPTAVIPLVFLLLIIVTSLFARQIAPYAPDAFDLPNRLSGPTARHLLGADELGRDMLSRLLYGGTKALVGIVEAVLTAVLIALPVGILAGYVGGAFDRAVSFVTDLVLAIPAIILVLVVLTVFPANLHAAMVALGVLVAPGFARIIRGVTLPLKEADFVSAARVAGVSEGTIMVRHILPGVLRTAIVQASFVAANALLFAVGLGFLGLTATPGEAEWGQIVAAAAQQISTQPWLLVPSGGLIALMALALMLLGNALRDATADVGSGAEVRPVKTGTESARMPREHASESARLPDPAALLSVRNLSVVFESRGQDTLIVDGVSFDVRAGETVGLVGESGAGKSVTALAVLRLLARGGRISGGQVIFDGQELTDLDDRAFAGLRGSALGLISQEPLSSLDPAFTIGSQLGELVQLHDGLRGAKNRERCLELLRQVQMRQPERVLQAYPHELSGGMAQRVAIAMALAGRPRLLIADEPTTALDVTVQKEILSLLRDLQRDTGMAVLIVTHNLGVVADICDRVIVLYAGQVFEDAGVYELFDRPLNPYTLGLLGANPAHAQPGQPLTVIPGRVPPPGSWPAHCRFAARCAFAAPECLAGPVPLLHPVDHHASRCIRIDELFLNPQSSPQFTSTAAGAGQQEAS